MNQIEINNPTFDRLLKRGCARRRGAAFIVALLVITLLASVALLFARQMRTEALAASNHTAHTQARWIAMGVLDAVRGDLTQSLQNGEYPRLDTVQVDGAEMAGGYYWILGHDDDESSYAFGLIGESGKLHLSVANAESLVELPGVSEDLAAAIVDWRDGDSDVSPGGAESEYYSSRQPPYTARDGSFETVDELLLVKGMTPEILYGEDRNRNGVLDANERDGDENPPADNGDNTLDLGLIDLLTVYSLEANQTLAGEDRANLNQPNGELLEALTEALEEKRGTEVFGLVQTQRPYQNLLDFYVRANLTEAEFDSLFDKITAEGNNNLRGLVDLYTAPSAVIDAIEGMDPGDGELIVAGRPVLQAEEQPAGLGWVTDLIGNDKAIDVGARVTNHSRQYTADIIAVTKDGRSFCRLRVVLDTRVVTDDDNVSLPRILYLEDLTHLGWPLSPTILTQLKQTGTLPDATAMTSTLSEDGLR